jgi:hypothetical protein
VADVDRLPQPQLDQADIPSESPAAAECAEQAAAFLVVCKDQAKSLLDACLTLSMDPATCVYPYYSLFKACDYHYQAWTELCFGRGIPFPFIPFISPQADPFSDDPS